MKNFIHRYRMSKYRCFAGGLLFAVISATALIFCLSYADFQPDAQVKITLCFVIAISSLLMGLIYMFRNNVENQKKNMNMYFSENHH